MADNNITLASNNLSEEAPGDSGEVDTIQFGIPTNSGEEQNFSGFNLPSFSGQSESSNPFGLGANTQSTKTEKKPSIVRPTDTSKMFAIVVSIGLVIIAFFVGIYVHKKLDVFAHPLGTSKIDIQPNGPMFGGTVLAEKYNEDQMKIFKKIESGETLTSAEKMFLARTVKKSVEINSIIRSKFKDYYPAE